MKCSMIPTRPSAPTPYCTKIFLSAAAFAAFREISSHSPHFGANWLSHALELMERPLKASPGQQALELSKSLPDDVQGVFFIVAQAAVTTSPCPSDATIARAYGTHSARRARRLLTYFEEQGLVVVRTDFTGNRVVAFPDLGCETAAGDPNGPDEQTQEQYAAE